jgi:hypothetical protein
VPKSICPVKRAFSSAITRPMSRTVAAPTAAIAASTAAAVSASLSWRGRNSSMTRISRSSLSASSSRPPSS